MYCIISKKYGKAKRGAYTTAERMAKAFPEYCISKDIDSITDINKLRKKYRLILYTHVPAMYGGKWSIARGSRDIVYIRDRFNVDFINSYTNGFYYWKNTSIKTFIPIITDFKVKTEWPKRLCIGFYNSPNVKPDSSEYFKKMLSQSNVDFYVMGSKFYNIPHTYDNVKFWNRISHYVYYPSTQYIDPFPNSLLEAVNNNIQIIIPEVDRNHKDGIDDIKDCIKYHTTFEPHTWIDNSDTILKAKNFKNFYTRMFENDFQLDIDKNKYNTFKEWCENETYISNT